MREEPGEGGEAHQQEATDLLLMKSTAFCGQSGNHSKIFQGGSKEDALGRA